VSRTNQKRTSKQKQSRAEKDTKADLFSR